MHPLSKLAVAWLATATLAGCGGGGGSSAGADTTSAAANAAASAATLDVTAPATDTGSTAASAPQDTNASAGDAPPALAAATDFASESLATADVIGSAAQLPSAVLEQPANAGLLATQTTGLATASALAATPVLTVRARADLAGGVGAMMAVRVDGVPVGSVEVKSTDLADYSFSAPTLKAGAKVDVVYSNDAQVGGQDRNLYVGYLSSGGTLVMPTSAGSIVDKGTGAAAFDGKDTLSGQGELYWSSALRLTWPAAPATDASLAARTGAARFLMQASFGPTAAEVSRTAGIGATAWLNEQIALPFTPNHVNFVQSKYALGDAYRPGGAKFDQAWVMQQFWASAAGAPDQLRQRVGWALHQIFMASHADSSLWANTRAYANYLDTLNKNAFGNYRNLLEDMALSPAMGIYLSHMRNRKEDASTGRMPDENFAREVMQLFSIGLYELNNDGTPKLGSNGKPVETYTTADVVAMAKVFTGWGWGFPDSQLTEANFRWGNPDITTAKDSKIDLLRMKAYPGQHSPAEKRLFTGKANAVVIPANGNAADSLRLALDALYRHPNVGPFVSRQLIQHLVASNPSPAYVGRVATVFNNNGKGVRGDLAAVVRAILLDTEARTASAAADYGKLREPVLRVAHWMRAFGATSSSGEFMMGNDLDAVSQRPLYAASVFGYFRPGYVPPSSAFSTSGVTAPELQIVNESTTAAWVNLAQAMSGDGLGWTGSKRDVSANMAAAAALAAAGNLAGLADHLNLLLFAGRMSGELRQAIYDAVQGVGGSDSASHTYRARVALFLALASNEFQVQR
jgi:uncharacterized protein (DUF1800 family)